MKCNDNAVITTSVAAQHKTHIVNKNRQNYTIPVVDAALSLLLTPTVASPSSAVPRKRSSPTAEDVCSARCEVEEVVLLVVVPEVQRSVQHG